MLKKQKTKANSKSKTDREDIIKSKTERILSKTERILSKLAHEIDVMVYTRSGHASYGSHSLQMGMKQQNTTHKGLKYVYIHIHHTYLYYGTFKLFNQITQFGVNIFTSTS